MELNLKYFWVVVLVMATCFCGEKVKAQGNVADSVTINVNFNREVGSMNPIWACWGYDEPNYTYMKDGKKLLSEIAALSPVPVYVRAHSLLVTGEGTHALKWGSTNAYTEDKNGNPWERFGGRYISDAIRVRWGATNNYYSIWDADFCNEEYLQWYINSIKACIDYYHPAGIAWDMAWNDNGWTDGGYSISHPESGIHHGMLRAMYEIQKYITENYPQMRSVSNNAYCNPSNLFVDAVLYEGITQGSGEQLEYEMARAYDKTLVSMYYSSLYSANPPQDVMETLALGSSWAGAVGDIEGNNPPVLRTLTELANFSAKTNAAKLVTSFKPIRITPEQTKMPAKYPNIYGSVWASADDCLLFLYNQANI